MIGRPLFLILVLVLTACAGRPCCTDYVVVTPVKLVPPTKQPSSSFGWLETDARDATAFRVKVGNKQYFELLDRVGSQNIVDELAFFSEREVTKRNYCGSGNAKTRDKGIYGPHTGEYVSLLVECVE